ncbi:23S rRNA (adenine(2030)-N(6))-methyltransferase RlmJ [uncultured Alsobacter sp.]|uniref:23S rRNA (adenine(2030)-N(6))-methyltransferase RlmJ n=1 Tax=uncultured Alsobacter sp. TaxID=1748258 RepID=UPI0025EEA73F|nr:23S rRNA (adenine(2030)-N(6))-methyltransferase RlmJ [uncultured Alsobacter sp.]
MNYRHAYHAGNFADVVKHAILARMLVYLGQKDAPFRVIDTHAGIGVYDLGSVEAGKTGEWHAGIGRLLDARLEPKAAELLAPYLETVAACRALYDLPLGYPGSPEIARHLARAQDRLIFIEKHPTDARRLRERMEHDRRAKVIELDGWTGLKAYVPPVERRGLVLIDPPFEEQGEFDRLAALLSAAWKKWPSGVYAAWYPLKDKSQASAFRATLSRSEIRKVLCIELQVNDRDDSREFSGTGLAVVNPPWPLFEECQTMLPALASILRQGNRAPYRCEWLTGET